MSVDGDQLRDLERDIDRLVRVRSQVEVWTQRASESLWDFYRAAGEPSGSFWKDSKAARGDNNSEPANITTTARAYVGFMSADRVEELDADKRHRTSWVDAFNAFAARPRVFCDGLGFREVAPKARQGGDQREEQNTFDVAHLVDLIMVDEYLRRFHGRKNDRCCGEAFREQVPGSSPADFPPLAIPKGAIAKRLIESLKQSVGLSNSLDPIVPTPGPKEPRAGPSTSAQKQSSIRGEVRFEPDNEESAHYFATVHVLRALHALGERVPDDVNGRLVEGARAFCIEQCYYFSRGVTHNQDPVRLAFAACIYVLYEEHVDRDLCLAVVQTLAEAQQTNGSWPATHPIIRKKERLPWHISSHEVALSLSWLYFQPRVPDAARPLILKMMATYFSEGILPSYHGGTVQATEALGTAGDQRSNWRRGWQDDHTRSQDTTVGWANAVVCHFLSNFSAVLSDWINRAVIEELGLASSTPRYLIDNSAEEPSTRWTMQGAEQAVWPDLPPHGWSALGPEIPTLKAKISEKWTDPEINSMISEKIASKVIVPIFDDPRGRTAKRATAGLLPGSPGTRKTSLVKQVAKVIGWPMVSVPASLIFERGFENMEAQATFVFSRLNHLRSCVIFFDEFEEFFTSRGESGDNSKRLRVELKSSWPLIKFERATASGGAGYQSRTIAAFTTSAMLPRLQDLHDRQRCLIFLATNWLGKMDSAIVRTGRFDFIATIEHPTVERLIQYVGELRSRDPAADAPDKSAVYDTVQTTLRRYRRTHCLKFAVVEQLLREAPKISLSDLPRWSRVRLDELVGESTSDVPAELLNS